MKKHEQKHVTKHETKQEHKPTSRRNTRVWVMAVLLGLLIVVSGIQAVELVSLKEKITTEMGTITKTKPLAANTAGSSSSSGDLQANLRSLENLETMVGGC